MVPEVNIGLVGHVDHGKTSLAQALTHKWTDTHSEEMKRGITIRIGYADVTFYRCDKCKKYTNTQKCVSCFEDAKPLRTASFVDAPGHETLMATVLSGSALMDGALLLVSADEKCPQTQTAEHLKVLDIAGIKNIIIVQNKIDLVSEEDARKNYKEIRDFVRGTIAENAPVIPVSAVHNINIDLLIEEIEKTIPTPERDSSKNPRFYIARSFDINKPGTPIKELKGGVVGGSLIHGVLKAGDEIEIRPGIKTNEKWVLLKTKITEISQAGKREEARPGGLAALQTELDPSLTRGDALAGGLVGTDLPPNIDEITIMPHLFDHIIGIEGTKKVDPIKTGDTIMMTVAIAKTVGVVTSSDKTVRMKLKLPICAERGDKVSMAKQVHGRWHLIGWGEIA
ncbi:MAG: translation initiation factor IF-2 subunit gamma [Candidatus Aenigmarchaeota archaeon]|nr:translation initiation factor IF-2 subunit gamma [Candidatus Aenigmarchaeota archaeon]MDI6722521.1 translation initiation factor IF-2 subunit gamma [Candidatus Aenigmarchaeota archaeon]